jgi:hypothetical protein
MKVGSNSAPQAAKALPAGELHIEFCNDALQSWVWVTGRRWQLVAEGLIPNNIEWPRNSLRTQWKAGGFDYTLRRTRPEGFKGPMRAWLAVDNWTVFIKPDWSCFDAATILSERRLVKETCPYGRAHRTARKDRTFQAFLKTALGK